MHIYGQGCKNVSFPGKQISSKPGFYVQKGEISLQTPKFPSTYNIFME